VQLPGTTPFSSASPGASEAKHDHDEGREADDVENDGRRSATSTRRQSALASFRPLDGAVVGVEQMGAGDEVGAALQPRDGDVEPVAGESKSKPRGTSSPLELAIE
jgi:hypothetical protein